MLELDHDTDRFVPCGHLTALFAVLPYAKSASTDVIVMCKTAEFNTWSVHMMYVAAGVLLQIERGVAAEEQSLQAGLGAALQQLVDAFKR